MACFAELGHNLIGIDISKSKIKNLKSNKLPIFEPNLVKMINSNIKKKRIYYTSDLKEGLLNSDCSLVCVGTPAKKNGSTNLFHILKVAKEIAKQTKQKKNYTVLFRSTIPPKTIEKKIIPIFKKFNNKSQIIFHPEFLREGTAIHDFFHPSRIIFGFIGKPDNKFVKKLYQNKNLNFSYFNFKTAELIKYIDNIWHATKVVFANEVARLSLSEGISPNTIMNSFINDTKLNISNKYLKPGNAFGGSCLPKDVSSIKYISKKNKINTPLFSSIELSNSEQIEFIFNKIKKYQTKKLGFYGITFKKNTDDCRESPIIKIISKLLIEKKSTKIKIYDDNIKLKTLVGTNKQYLYSFIKNPNNYFTNTAKELIEFAEVIIVNNSLKKKLSFKKDKSFISIDDFFN